MTDAPLETSARRLGRTLLWKLLGVGFGLGAGAAVVALDGDDVLGVPADALAAFGIAFFLADVLFERALGVGGRRGR